MGLDGRQHRGNDCRRLGEYDFHFGVFGIASGPFEPTGIGHQIEFARFQTQYVLDAEDVLFHFASRDLVRPEYPGQYVLHPKVLDHVITGLGVGATHEDLGVGVVEDALAELFADNGIDLVHRLGKGGHHDIG